MLNTFFESLKLNNTYKVNKLIYTIKKTAIGDSLTNESYANKNIKIMGNIINFIKSLITLFVGKLVVFGILYGLMQYLDNQGVLVANGSTFFHILFFSIICEAFVQSNMFEKNEWDYYAINSLKMNAKQYVLSNYYWKMFLRIISFIFAFIILKDIIEIPVNIGILLSIFSVMIKTVFNNLKINDYIKDRNTIKKIMFPLAIAIMLIAIGLPMVNITISFTLFKYIYVIVLFLGIFSFFKLAIHNNYYKIYKKVLMLESNATRIEHKEINVKKQEKNNTFKTTNNKESGFKYLNSLFINRNRKKLYLPVILTSLGLFAESTLMFCGVLYNQDIQMLVMELAPLILGILIFIIFEINMLMIGKVFVETLFEKCDQAMLTFKSFRTKKAVIKSFKERAITLLKLSFLPTFIIAIQPILIFKICGLELTIIENLTIFIVLIIIGILASINTLFIYYLIQPYTYNSVMKKARDNRPIINIMSCILLFIPFVLLMINMKIALIGILWFSIIYIVVGIKAINKKAFKTFKLNVE